MTLDLPDFTKAVGGIDKDGNPIQQFNVPPVWFHDDFEAGIFKWLESAGTVTHYASPGPAAIQSRVYNGTACMKIVSDVGDTGAAVRSFGSPSLTNNVAISFIFTLETLADFDATIGKGVTVLMTLLNTVNSHYVFLCYIPTTGKWYVSEDASVSWEEVLGFKIEADVPHYVKMVFNFDTLKYVKLYVDHRSVDLSAYNIHQGVNPSSAQLTAQFTITGDTGDQAEMYVDDVMITHNEP